MTNFKSLCLAMNDLINQEKSLHSIKFDIHRLLIKLTTLSVLQINLYPQTHTQHPKTENRERRISTTGGEHGKQKTDRKGVKTAGNGKRGKGEPWGTE